jgi:dienelactone hydrolase
MCRAALACLVLCAAAPGRAADSPSPHAPAVEKGSFTFKPLDDQSEVPARYRLTERSFAFELAPRHDLPAAGVRVSHLTFPSPVHTPHPENNTVHAEYYCPLAPGHYPAVIVLDVTAGDQSLSRTLSTWLAQNGVAALFVQMAYYGPRRPPGSRLRLLMPNIDHSLGAVRQTILDLRVAAAWLASRPEVDAHRLGILGTSLGSFLAALAAEMEPRLGRVVVLLGGGGLVDAYYDHPKATTYRKLYEAVGGSKEQLARVIAPADPLTCAANLKDRRLLIVAGKRDEIVPPKMARALWDASGRQKIVWYDCGHYTAVLYLVPAFDHVLHHFRAD